MAFGRAKEDRPTPPEVYNWRVYVVALFATLGSWMFGYNNGVIGGCIVLPSFHRDFNLPTFGTTEYSNVTSNIVSFLQIGALAGSLLIFSVVRHFGRRWALGCGGGVFFIGSAMQVFAHGSLSLMYSGRAISGIGLGCVTVLIPMYISEISPPAIRGSLVGLYEINNQVSSLCGFWSNYLVSLGMPASISRQWQIPLAMQLIPAGLLVLATLLILPESPCWLMEQGCETQARKVLSFIRHLDVEHEYINYEIKHMEEALLRQHRRRVGADRWNMLRELTWKGNSNRLIIGCALMWGANGSGINGVNFYTPSIFKSIGFTGTTTALLLSGFFAVAKTSATFISLMFFIDRYGRRKLLLVASAGIASTLLYIGVFVTATNGGGGMRSPGGYFAVVCIYIYAISFSIAWNGVPWVYCSEIFPGRLKELCMCLTTAVQWIAQFVIARVSPYMITAGAGSSFFFFFAGSSVVSGILVFLFLPETKGLTLDGMDVIFGTPYKNVRQEGIILHGSHGNEMVGINSTV